MPDRPLTAKQQAFVQYYADSGSPETYLNASQSYKKAYPNTKGGWDKLGPRLMVNDGIKRAIGEYRAKTTAKLEHNRQIAIDQLNKNLAALDKIILEQPMNVAAITARTGVIRELDAISMLHGSSLEVNTEAPAPLTTEQQQQAQRASIKLLEESA
ncbi:MAG: terminase small subunit [Planctomycetota bacterium]|jgi:hypothetical protein